MGKHIKNCYFNKVKIFTIDVDHLFGSDKNILSDFVKQVQNMKSNENIMWLHNFSDDAEKTEKLKTLLCKHTFGVQVHAQTLLVSIQKSKRYLFM